MPSRLRRLDDALAALPVEEPMLLSELDGFLTALVVGREPIGADEWMQVIWGSDEGDVPPFDDPIDVRWFADAVAAHRDAIARDLARGRPQPLFDVDERNGELLWDAWLDGFSEAIALRPDAWAATADDGSADAVERLMLLIAVARDESTLDSVAINAIDETAPGDISAIVLALYRARPRAVEMVAGPAKVGRNDPCVCGSGKKSKRCCG